jgi:hypothetical protein
VRRLARSRLCQGAACGHNWMGRSGLKDHWRRRVSIRRRCSAGRTWLHVQGKRRVVKGKRCVTLQAATNVTLWVGDPLKDAVLIEPPNLGRLGEPAPAPIGAVGSVSIAYGNPSQDCERYGRHAAAMWRKSYFNHLERTLLTPTGSALPAVAILAKSQTRAKQ